MYDEGRLVEVQDNAADRAVILSANSPLFAPLGGPLRCRSAPRSASMIECSRGRGSSYAAVILTTARKLDIRVEPIRGWLNLLGEGPTKVPLAYFLVSTGIVRLPSPHVRATW